jgi:hypothetical protein
MQNLIPVRTDDRPFWPGTGLGWLAGMTFLSTHAIGFVGSLLLFSSVPLHPILQGDYAPESLFWRIPVSLSLSVACVALMLPLYVDGMQSMTADARRHRLLLSARDGYLALDWRDVLGRTGREVIVLSDLLSVQGAAETDESVGNALVFHCRSGNRTRTMSFLKTGADGVATADTLTTALFDVGWRPVPDHGTVAGKAPLSLDPITTRPPAEPVPVKVEPG